ncbi:hypothetical protein CEXT_515311 [Caerostris extrusa]|uniref:Uncharacterized protein n=1 Tax=Caerostris extrusa TaxID=172846 RepID=A0AAV4NUA4_CAEEX|nr:hypothetical protein CEXT_515311 [Caerostris extrusa]
MEIASDGDNDERGVRGRKGGCGQIVFASPYTKAAINYFSLRRIECYLLFNARQNNDWGFIKLPKGLLRMWSHIWTYSKKKLGRLEEGWTAKGSF